MAFLLHCNLAGWFEISQLMLLLWVVLPPMLLWVLLLPLVMFLLFPMLPLLACAEYNSIVDLLVLDDFTTFTVAL